MGFQLRMHSVIRDWLTELRDAEPELRRLAGEAVLALLEAGETLGPPLVVSLESALQPPDDPREVLDYSYQRQLEMLTKVRRGVADVATSRKRVELQMNQLQQQSNKLQDQARKALSMGREDLAREALTRKSSAQNQLDELQTQYAQLQGEEEKLTLASQRLQSKVDAFRTRKETIKATYTAAEAQTRINEAFSGISEEMGDVGMAIQRAEDKTAQMQARAGAIDELM